MSWNTSLSTRPISSSMYGSSVKLPVAISASKLDVLQRARFVSGHVHKPVCDHQGGQQFSRQAKLSLCAKSEGEANWTAISTRSAKAMMSNIPVGKLLLRQ